VTPGPVPRNWRPGPAWWPHRAGLARPARPVIRRTRPCSPTRSAWPSWSCSTRLVARGALASSGRAGHSRLALVNGAVSIVFAPAGRLQAVLALTVSTARRITAIDVIADPDRLRRLRLAVLPD
jgi:hypothetical protein